MQRVQINNGRSPFEFALVGVSLTSGIAGLISPTPGPSAAIAKAFGPGTAWFYGVLMASALIVIVGACWPRRTIHQFMFGMKIERVGLLPLGGASMAYAAATILSTGPSAALAAGMIGGIGIAACVRARMITTDLGKIDCILAVGATGKVGKAGKGGT